MARAELAPVIIVRKKKVVGHGHHGGAWKVAYADFVTAMMALFIVLWLMSASEKVKQSIASYFRDPTGPGKHMGSAQAGTGESLNLDKTNMKQLEENLRKAMKELPNVQQLLKDRVHMVVTGEGLRIEFTENEQGLFFHTGNATPTAEGTELLAGVAREIGKLRNSVLIEGHTDSKPFGKGTGYGNWELSSDRANAARRVMEHAGLKPQQVSQVRGYADQRLRDRGHPENASNRRISIVVRYSDAEQAEVKNEAPLPAAAATAHH